jgi:hypothetical protein
MLWCTGAMQRRGYRRVAGAMIQRLACLSSPWPSAVTCLFSPPSELALIASPPSCQGSRRDSIHIGNGPVRRDSIKKTQAQQSYMTATATATATATLHHSTFSFCICMIFAYLALNTHQTPNPLFLAVLLAVAETNSLVRSARDHNSLSPRRYFAIALGPAVSDLLRCSFLYCVHDLPLSLLPLNWCDNISKPGFVCP